MYSLSACVAAVKPGWVVDSGATSCATFDPADCRDVRPCNITVTAAGSSFTVRQIGTAILRVLDKDRKLQHISIANCLISPKFPFRLLALQCFTNKGYEATMKGDEIIISHAAGNISLKAEKDAESKLFFLQDQPRVPNTCNSLLARAYSGPFDPSLLWKLHLRHGHRNFADICRQYKIPVPVSFPTCTSCVMGKSTMHGPTSNSFERAKRRGEGFHTDFKGPFSVPTPFGDLYLLTITDDHTRRIFAWVLKTQTEWFEIWVKFVARIEAELGHSNCIAWLLCDNGKVFCSKDMESFCENKGIQIRHSAPYAQWMDHTAERNMRTISEMAITTMLHANMPKKAWGWAILLAVDVLNRTAASHHINKQANAPSNASPLEKWYGRSIPTQTKGLMPFGCLAFKHIPLALRNKLDAHAIPCVYLGIDPASHSFILGSIYDLTVSVSVYVTFMENAFPFRKIKANDASAGLLWDCDSASISGDPRLGMFDSLMEDSSGLRKLLDKEAKKVIGQLPIVDFFKPERATAPPPLNSSIIKADEIKVAPVEEPSDIFSNLPSADHFKMAPVKILVPELRQEGDNTKPDVTRVTRKSTRTSAPTRVKLEGLADIDSPPATLISIDDTIMLDDNLSAICCTITEASLQSITPTSAYQALFGPQGKQWLKGMQREKDCHIKNETFGDCHISELQLKDLKPIPANWVFKIKHRGGPIEIEDLEDKQFKCRVVIRGQFMKEGIHFNDTFAPVPKPPTVRALLAYAARHSLLIKSGDVETAFLTAKMDCTIYVKMPPFWGNSTGPIDSNNAKGGIRLLLKGVPGIPQGSRLFHETISAFLISIDFQCSKADKCLFFRKTGGCKEIILIWVDDFIWVGRLVSQFECFMKEIRVKFTVPIADDMKCFLGMSVCYDARHKLISLSQENTIDVLLERAKMTDCNPSPVPAASGIVFTKQDCPIDIAQNKTITEYRSLIALINFISCWTRPDIAFITNKLCKFMSNPGDIHWKFLRLLIKYLAGTKKRALVYDMSKENPLTLHGYTDSSFGDCPDTGRSTLAYVFFYSSALLSWYSKLSSSVLTCTNHAEYAALALGAKECEWMLTLFDEMECKDVVEPIPIFIDNSGVISMVANPVDHQANKHVKISQHYTRELAAAKIIAPQRVDTSENPADAFTKPLPAIAFKKYADVLLGTVSTKQEFACMFKLSREEREEMYGVDTQGEAFYITNEESSDSDPDWDRAEEKGYQRDCAGCRRHWKVNEIPASWNLNVTEDPDDSDYVCERLIDNNDKCAKKIQKILPPFVTNDNRMLLAMTLRKVAYWIEELDPACWENLLSPKYLRVWADHLAPSPAKKPHSCCGFPNPCPSRKINIPSTSTSAPEQKDTSSECLFPYCDSDHHPAKLQPFPFPVCCKQPDKASITCMSCETASTFGHCNITCTACKGEVFNWLCECMTISALENRSFEAHAENHSRFNLSLEPVGDNATCLMMAAGSFPSELLSVSFYAEDPEPSSEEFPDVLAEEEPQGPSRGVLTPCHVWSCC